MHIFVCGITLHGKSFLVKKLTEAYLKSTQYRGAMVCDVNQEPMQNYHAIYSTIDPLKLMAVAKRNKKMILIHEECSESMRAGSKMAYDCSYFSTRCRHQGHRSIFIAPTPQSIDRVFRAQCTSGFIFKLSPLDSEYAAKMLGYKEYLHLMDLQKYEFMTYRPGEPPKILKLSGR